MIDRQLSSPMATHPSRSVSELLQEAATHTEKVVRGEIQLAVVRVQDDLTSRARRAASIAIGGVLGAVTLVVLLVAAILRLSESMAPWLATTIVGVATGFVAAALIVAATRDRGGDA